MWNDRLCAVIWQGLVDVASDSKLAFTLTNQQRKLTLYFWQNTPFELLRQLCYWLNFEIFTTGDSFLDWSSWCDLMLRSRFNTSTITANWNEQTHWDFGWIRNATHKYKPCVFNSRQILLESGVIKCKLHSFMWMLFKFYSNVMSLFIVR